MSYVEQLRKKIGHDEYIGVGAGIFIYKDRNVLLQKRKDNGCWSMHAGGLEIGETVEEAAKRELLEETGLTANTLCLLGVFSGEDMRYTYPNGDKVSIVQIIYTCNDFSGDITREQEEVSELKWFDINEIPDNISPPDKKAFDSFINFIKFADTLFFISESIKSKIISTSEKAFFKLLIIYLQFSYLIFDLYIFLNSVAYFLFYPFLSL